jgi:hypothetical protein
VIVAKRTVHFGEMVWPRAVEPDDDSVQWRLRYGPQPPSQSDILYAASVMSAYSALVYKPQRARNSIVRVLRSIENTGQVNGE